MKDVVLGALKVVMKNRGLGMNVKVLHEKVVVLTVMYGSESWDMKVNERQTKCVRDEMFEEYDWCISVG